MRSLRFGCVLICVLTPSFALHATLRRSGSIELFVPDTTFNVLDYGAKGDGKNDDTKAIQTALDDAGKAGGTVLLPSSHTFLSFAIQFRGSSTNLQVDGTLKVSNDRDHWPDKKDVITATDLSDIAITGKGMVDGDGSEWWAHRDDFRPRLVYFEHCTNVLIDSLTFKDSPNHNLELYSDNTELSGITILAPPSTDVPVESHNTDAVDVHGDPFYVHDCTFSVGDDNIAAHANNTLVEDCVFGTGHGASIGSVGDAWLQNITFNRITFTNTTTGMRIKTDTNTAGGVKQVRYTNLVMHSVGETVSINMFYPDGSGGKATMKIQDILFSNITAYNSGSPGGFLCDPHSPCEDIQLDNFKHVDTDGDFQCEHAHGSTSGEVSPKSCLEH